MTGANQNQGELNQWILAQGRQRICVLSPHLDDGVYSAFAAITCPLPVYREVVTVITETASEGSSVWGSSAGFSSRSEEFEARREEDRRVLGNLGVACRHLGAQEGDRDSIRLAVINAITASDPDTLFLIPAGAGTAKPPGAVRRLARRLGRKPAGSAAHPEHLIVRDAAIEVLKATRGLSVAFYAEQPYLWNDTAAQIMRNLAAATAMRIVMIRCVPDLERKIESALDYSSQALLMFGTKSWYQRRTLGRAEEYFVVG